MIDYVLNRIEEIRLKPPVKLEIVDGGRYRLAKQRDDYLPIYYGDYLLIDAIEQLAVESSYTIDGYGSLLEVSESYHLCTYSMPEYHQGVKQVELWIELIND